MHQKPEQERYVMKRMGFLLGFGLLFTGFVTPLSAQDFSRSFSSVIKKVTPAVVSVESFRTITMREPEGIHDKISPDLRKRLFPEEEKRSPQKKEEKGAGSGFIIDSEGYVVTNYHVIKDAERVEIVFENKSRSAAQIIGYDVMTDIALLKSNPKKSPAKTSTKNHAFVTFGDSDTTEAGDWVIAMGNPFGRLSHTATVGIISAKNRRLELRPDEIVDYLQVDASINMGNSGGPLFDMQGDVVGINTVIISPTGGSVGLGFAIPSNAAKFVVNELRVHNRVRRGFVGMATEDVSDDPDSTEENFGARVKQINVRGPAYEGGIRKGDIIISFNGREVKTGYDFAAALLFTTVGSSARVGILRNGRNMEFTVSVRERAERN